MYWIWDIGSPSNSV